METFRKVFCRASFIFVALVLITPFTANAEKVIKLSHLNPPNVFEATSAAVCQVFKSLVESHTNGEIKVEVFDNSVLGKDHEIVQQVRDGIIQAAVAGVGGIAAHFPLIDLVNVPFAYNHISTTYGVLDGPFGKALGAELEAHTGDLKLLAFTDNGGFMHFSNSKRPITTVEDMKGLRIRTMPIKSHEICVTALGAKATPLAWSELYTALQTGVVDGQMNPLSIIAFAKFDEVQKYLTLSGHICAPHVFVINKKFYGSLTPFERSVVDNATTSALVASRGVGRTMEASEQGLKKLAKRMKVNALTPEVQAQFRAKTVPAVSEFIKTTYGEKGEKLLKFFLSEVETVKKIEISRSD